MKKTFQIFFCLLVCSFALAQEKKDSVSKNTMERKWSMQIQGGPDYVLPSFYYYPEVAQGLIKYNFSVLINRNFTKVSALNLGMSYNSLYYKTWLPYNPSYMDFYSYSICGVAISYRLKTAGKKIYANLDCGLAVDVLIDNHYNGIYVSKSFFSNGSTISSFVFSPGINFKLNNRLVLNISLKSSFAFIPLTFKESAIDGDKVNKNYLKYFSGNIGVQYNF